MEYNQYNTTVQQWIHTVLENRETNAAVVLQRCKQTLPYAKKKPDKKKIASP